MTEVVKVSLHLEGATPELPERIVMCCYGGSVRLSPDEAGKLAAGLLEACLAIEDAWETSRSAWTWRVSAEGEN